MIVRRAMKASRVVAGGGAVEMALSKHLRAYARNISGKNQLIINAFAKSLETIPRNIADNAGLDSVDVLNRLRQKHSQDLINGHHFGIDINDLQGVGNTYQLYIWEPIIVKRNALAAACEVQLIYSYHYANYISIYYHPLYLLYISDNLNRKYHLSYI